MRQIGTVGSEQQARLFEDYLLTQGVKVTVEEESDGWTVWIYDEDQLERAKQELAEFQAAADDPKYSQAAPQAEKIRQQELKKNIAWRKRQIDVRQRWNRPLLQSCPVTFAMIGISVVVAILTRLGGQVEPVGTALAIASYRSEGSMVYWHGLDDVLHGQVWRLVTPIFLHFGILHIVFNMLWLRELGTAVEYRRGSWRYALIVATIAAISNLSEYYCDLALSLRHFPPIDISWQQAPLFGGMSGVVFGLFGYVWIKSRYDPESGFFLHSTTIFWMMAWLVLCMSGFVGRIANAAHGVGLLAGVVLAYAPILRRDLTR